MLSRTIFFCLLSFLAYSENNFKDLSLDEFKQLLDSSNNKRAFYKEYLSYLEEADGDVNAVIALILIKTFIRILFIAEEQNGEACQ